MRSHYEPVTDVDRLMAAFGVTLPDLPEGGKARGVEPAAFIVAGHGTQTAALGELWTGQFGLRSSAAPGDDASAPARECPVNTMKSNPRFRESWWAGRRCVVPVERLTAWCYEAGRPEAWAIQRADGRPLALAGLWHDGAGPDGERRLSFCVLTLDATGHAVYGRLRHPLAPEARMPALLPADVQRRWLHGSLAEAQQLLVPCPAADLQAAPLAPADTAPPPAWRAEPDLFAEEGWWVAPETHRQKPARPRTALRPRVMDAPGPVTADLFAGS
ncbi:MAG: hypothetical protein EKK53_09655 [Burkholderiales bacterium]|nr:MAG: hypothetical protein EKK53_09655 [Burkholderiales bacterium]